MKKTFGTRLKQFALSVDIVDEQTINDVWSLLQDYLKRELKIEYFRLMREQPVNDNPGLRTDLSSDEHKPIYTIKTPEGDYSGQAAYAFGEDKCIWIVSTDKQPLNSESEYQDFWSQSVNLPKVDQQAHADVRTSIIIPLRWIGRPFGVITLETTEYQESTKVALKELQVLADTVAKMHILRETREAQRTSTRDAIGMLRDALREETWPTLAKPQMFIAFPAKRKEDVVGQIRKVLDEFKGDLKLVYWEDISTSGDVSQQILEEIGRSKFGLCYFSEPAQNTEKTKYRDNPNVIFEAGMLQALTNSPTGAPTGWIPVREQPPPRIPFDFASQRILEVERTDDRLNKDLFTGELKKRVRGLLSL